MEKEEKKKLGKYIFWAVILVLVFLTYSILKPYLIALISAFILAYLIQPLYNKLGKKLNKKLSASICVLFVVLIILIPMAILASQIIQQANLALNNDAFKELLNKISSNSIIEKTNINLETIKTEFITLIISLFTLLVKRIPAMLISIIITLWGMYYILLNWDKLSFNLRAYLPFEKKEIISKEIDLETKGIIHGTLIIAILDFIVASIGFYLLGINAFFLFAAIISILAFIPGLGPGVVWMPIAIFNFLTGNYLVGIGVVVLGLILGLLIETYLQGKIVEKKTSINPLIRFIGVLGGVPVFGIFGFVIGPLILIYTTKILDGIMHK
jgi:predicted PurR-regulated permease PerM